jgi:anti-anti-sigma factor
MEYNKLINDNKVTYVLEGEMDAEQTQELRNEFVRISEAPEFSEVEIDLSFVTFIDSSGIGVIVFLFKQLRQHNVSLLLTGVNGQPLELISLLRIDTVIDVHKADIKQHNV